MPIGMFFGFQLLRSPVFVKQSAKIVEAIPSEEQIIQMVKNQLALQEKAAPVVLSFIASQLALSASAVIGVMGICVLFYLRNQDKKVKLGHKLSD